MIETQNWLPVKTALAVEIFKLSQQYSLCENKNYFPAKLAGKDPLPLRR